MTTSKTATELEAMLMEQLEKPILRSTVSRGGHSGRRPRRMDRPGRGQPGMHIMYECARAMNEIAKALGRDYDLQHDADSPPRR